jgi:uncharacterized protein YndB with AHSA1/START domain
VEQVFATISDPRTYPDWLVGAQRIRAVDRSFPKPGAEFEHSVGPTGAVTVDDSSEVLEADAPHHLRLQVRAGVFTATVDFEVHDVGDGSEVRFRELPSGWARPLTPLLRPLLLVRNKRSLRQLADHDPVPDHRSRS